MPSDRCQLGSPGDVTYPVGGFGPESGLTTSQAWPAQQRLTLAIQRRRQQGRPCKGPWMAAIIGGVVSAVRNGRVGNRTWGRSMFAKRGGPVMARHAPHHLRAIAPLGARASVIARDQRKAQGAFEPEERRLAGT
jgi:hypothetical protein